MLAGHSLGGSLALLLALDTLVNHTYESSSNNASSPYDRDEMNGKNGKNDNMHRKNKKLKNDSDSNQTSSSSHSNSKSGDAPSKRTSTSTYRSNSYSHHNDKRCTSTAHVSVLDRLHIVTFGQPELADPLFFEGLKVQHNAAKKLLEERYQQSF